MFNDLIQAYFNGDFFEEQHNNIDELRILLNKVYNMGFIDGKREGFEMGSEVGFTNGQNNILENY